MYRDKLCKILHTSDIKENNLEYYYTKYPQWNREYRVDPMFDDIKPFEYHQPLQYLNYSKEIIELAKKHSGSMVVKSSSEMDQIMLEYIKCRPHSLLLTVWYKVTKSDLLEYLNSIGHVYCMKYINLSLKAAHSLIYQLFADVGQYKDMDSISDLLKQVYKFSGGYITVIVFDNIKSEHIELIKMSINHIIVKKHSFHMSNQFYKTIEYAQIYFCENSLKFLESQSLDRHIDVRMRKSRILLATFKRWLVQNVDLKDRRGFLILSGSILYTYGVRNIHDIDMYVDGSCYTPQVKRYLIDPISKFYFVDANMPGTPTWRKYWDKWGIKWAQLMGAKDFDEVLYNIKIPSIPMTQKKYIHLKINEEVDINTLEKGQKYNPDNHEIEYNEKIDYSRFLSTMQWYLKTIYHDELEIDVIKPMVGIKRIKLRKK